LIVKYRRKDQKKVFLWRNLNNVTTIMLHSSYSKPEVVLLFLLVWSSNIRGYYSKTEKRFVIGDGSSKLVRVEPVEVQSLRDLTDGVYAMGISGDRKSVCGIGSGGTFVVAVWVALFYSILIEWMEQDSILLQSVDILSFIGLLS